MVKPALQSLPSSTQHADKSHLYEIDVIRAVTAICVVGVHTVAFTLILTHSSAGQLAQNAVESALHFTREIFLAITAFVMVYGYANRPFSGKTFWRKRGIGVLLPYIVWSLFYEWTQQPPLPPLHWALRLLSDLLTGSASFQLYYILLTLEFYLILPWFLSWIRILGKHPWWLLGSSFALQVILLALDYRYVQLEPFASSLVGSFLNLNQTRFLPFYQFYLVLGGLAALYMVQLRAFLLRHGGWTIAALTLALALLWGNLLYQTGITHMGMAYGISVFQPIMPLYAIAVAAFLYWITYRWAVSRAPRPPRGHRLWGLLSSASFGIYLMHAYILDQVMVYLVPNLPVQWFEPLRVALTWAVAAGITALLCSIMLYIPIVSRLIGHPCKLGRDTRVGSWSSAAELRLAEALGRAGLLVSAPTRRIEPTSKRRHGIGAVRADASAYPSLIIDSSGAAPMAKEDTFTG